MTREEIIEHLDSIVGTYEILLGHGVNSDILDVDDIEAIKEVISALSNKGDLISRQAVLEGIAEWVADGYADSEADISHISSLVTHLPSVENKGEWIPVSERLPEKNIWVLVTVEQNDNRYQEIMRRNIYTGEWTDNIDNYTDEITAWMPLPSPWKGE